MKNKAKRNKIIGYISFIPLIVILMYIVYSYFAHNGVEGTYGEMVYKLVHKVQRPFYLIGDHLIVGSIMYFLGLFIPVVGVVNFIQDFFRSIIFLVFSIVNYKCLKNKIVLILNILICLFIVYGLDMVFAMHGMNGIIDY